jgi:hypothetical protein
VAILKLNVLPTIFIGRALIVQADEQNLRSPAQAVADMDRGGLAARHWGLATGADMDFIKVTASTGKHMCFSSLGNESYNFTLFAVLVLLLKRFRKIALRSLRPEE